MCFIRYPLSFKDSRNLDSLRADVLCNEEKFGARER